ncbi:MAG: hypothetical protein PVG83_10860, partial [Acidimicrobiia bacterium]
VLGGGGTWIAPSVPIDLDRTTASRLFRISETDTESAPGSPVKARDAWQEIRAKWFPESHDWPRRDVTDLGPDEIRELEARHYNATITGFDTAHNELWRIRVRPDRESAAHLAGQYCSLGIGFWEPRADDAVERALDSKRHKLIRRSYSISSPIFDQHGYLVDHSEMDEIELYIVWVRADGHRVPELTPRLALKHVGDRLYLGPKITGRYNLRSVADPGAPLLFCATGTGEAPHNAMVVELLRKGHHGPILSAVSVRYRSDLAYLEEHRLLEARYDNYRYLPMPTREGETPKRYLQEMLVDGTLEDRLGSPLDPRFAHVFLCGNPKMIGLPDWDGDEPRFGDETGMTELLHQRGFTLDRRGWGGNVHYEEYW